MGTQLLAEKFQNKTEVEGWPTVKEGKIVGLHRKLDVRK